MREKGMKKLLLLAFFASGAAALIYQVLWMRKLSLLFGTTLYGVTTILTVFMLGLGLGSFLFGRLTDKSKRPLLIYALLELGVGIYAALTPEIFQLVEKAQLMIFKTSPQNFSSFHLVQFGLAILALIIPALLMGGTLPVAVKFLVRNLSETGKQVARLYFINTLGAVLGTLMAAFVLISLLGVNQTIYFAASINLLIGVVILLLRKKATLAKLPRGLIVKKKAIEQGNDKTRKSRWILLGAYFLAGVAALSLEVIWTRTLTPILGSSVYAFAIMLAAFLLGIALGSMAMTRLIDRIKKPLLVFVLVEALIGLLVLVTVPVFPQLSRVFLKFYQWSGGNFGQLQILEFLLSFLVMFGPAFLMGAAFPLVNRLVANRMKSLGESVGKVYFANTAGSALGPILAGFLLIPLLGLQKSLVISAGFYLLVAVMVAMFALKGRRLVKLLVFIGSTALVLLGWHIPNWDTKILNSGVYVYADRYLEKDPDLTEFGELLFYKEGLLATVAVKKTEEGELFLKTDGKTDAGTGGDMSTQLILGHLPMLLHPNPEEVLVIGLGSGITLGAVEQHPQLKTVDVVEIEPAVVEAASYFSKFNNNALQDPRLNMIIGDGRNYTLLTDKKYDVISAEPSNPWMTGNANLFTKEQFELYKSRLKPGGIMFQWAHTYDLTIDDFKMVIATFQKVFPHTTLWQSFDGGDVFLIGTEEPLKIDFAAWQKKIAQEKVKKDLARVYLDDPLIFLNLAALNEEGVGVFSQKAEIHTDNQPVLEFQSPKGILLDLAITKGGNFEALNKQRTSVFTLLEKIDDKELQERIALYALSRAHIMQGDVYFSLKSSAKGVAEYEKALSFVPNNTSAKKRLAEIYSNQGKAYFAKSLNQEAEKFFLRAVKWDPENLEYYQSLGSIYGKRGKFDEAIEVYERALKLTPDDAFFHFELGALYGEKGLLDKAEQELLQGFELDDENFSAHNNLALVYMLKGDKTRAIEELEASLEINLNQPEIKIRLLELQAGP